MREYHARFVRELAAARKVTGAFTAPVLGADTDGAMPWVASVFLPGLSMQEAVTRFGPLPPDVVRTLAAGLAEALTAIAAAGIAHRDIKPANIMLTSDGPRVIDFGIARFVEATAITAAGTMIGTPGYIAPEYLATGRSGPAGDVFALGAVLAFAATGRNPFGTGPVAARLARSAAGEIDLDGLDDQPLRELIGNCIRSDPEQRPTAAQILTRLSTAAPEGVNWLPHPVAQAISARRRAISRRSLLIGTGVAVAAAVSGVLLWPRGDGKRPPSAATSTTPALARKPGEGALAWETKVGNGQPELSVAAGLIHCRTGRTTAALDPRTRKVRWHHDRIESTAADGDRMYAATDALAVAALDAASGAERWTWRPAAREEHSFGPVVAGATADLFRLVPRVRAGGGHRTRTVVEGADQPGLRHRRRQHRGGRPYQRRPDRLRASHWSRPLDATAQM
jgi:hypothetical protein